MLPGHAVRAPRSIVRLRTVEDPQRAENWRPPPASRAHHRRWRTGRSPGVRVGAPSGGLGRRGKRQQSGAICHGLVRAGRRRRQPRPAPLRRDRDRRAHTATRQHGAHSHGDLRRTPGRLARQESRRPRARCAPTLLAGGAPCAAAPVDRESDGSRCPRRRRGRGPRRVAIFVIASDAQSLSCAWIVRPSVANLDAGCPAQRESPLTHDAARPRRVAFRLDMA